MNNNQAFIFWIVFLSCVIIFGAVVVNFHLGDSQFQIDLADYLATH